MQDAVRKHRIELTKRSAIELHKAARASVAGDRVIIAGLSVALSCLAALLEGQLPQDEEETQ